jgi:hypothetical protein
MIVEANKEGKKYEENDIICNSDVCRAGRYERPRRREGGKTQVLA